MNTKILSVTDKEIGLLTLALGIAVAAYLDTPRVTAKDAKTAEKYRALQKKIARQRGQTVKR